MANNATVNMFYLQLLREVPGKLRRRRTATDRCSTIRSMFYGSGMANSNVHATDRCRWSWSAARQGRGRPAPAARTEERRSAICAVVANQFGGSIDKFGESTGTVSFF